MALENFFYRFHVLVSLDGEVLLKGQNLFRMQLLNRLSFAAEREGCCMLQLGASYPRNLLV